MRFKLEEIFDILLKALAGGSIFLPLIVGGTYSIPALTPKVFFFQGVVLVMAAVYGVLLVLDWQRFRPRATPLTIAILAWGASLVISTFAGVDWHRSLWSTDVRMTGVFLVFHYILFYLISSSVFRKNEDWQWFFRLWLGVGIVTVLLALVFEVGSPELMYQSGGGGIRASSTLGNPTFFGGFAMTLVFFGYLAFLQAKQKKWAWLALGSIVFALVGVLASGTRGAFLGLACGLGFALILFLVFWIKQHDSKEAMRLLGFLLLPLLIFGGVSLVFLVKNAVLPAEVPVVERFTGAGATNTLHTRLLAWKAGIEAWKDKPLLGWGPSNFAYAFNAHYPPEILQYGTPEAWFDVAHSVLFETLATQGIVGVAAYLALFGAAGLMLWQGYQRRRVGIHFVGIAGGFLIAHFVFSLFLFEVPTSYFSFFFFLAFLNSQTQPDTIRHLAPEKSKPFKRLALPIAGIVLLLFPLLVVYALPAAINEVLVKATQSAQSDPGEALRWYAKATRIPSPYMRSAKVAFLDEVVTSLTSKELFLFAEKELKQLRAQEPLEIQHNLLLGKLYVRGAELFSELEMLAKAEAEFQDGLSKSPGRQQFQYELAMVKFKLGKRDEAILLFEKIQSSAPHVPTSFSPPTMLMLNP